MKTINQIKLLEILSNVKGAQPITISAFVDARAKKTGNPYSEIRKLSKVNGFTGADYETSVQRQETREGNAPSFEASERKWGERISPALVKNKDKFYLVIQPRATAKPIYFAKKVGGFFKAISKQSIADLLPVAKSNAEAQGVEKEIVYRNYSLESIGAISIGGEKYRVRH